jgi:hypothetical protein
MPTSANGLPTKQIDIPGNAEKGAKVLRFAEYSTHSLSHVQHPNQESLLFCSSKWDRSTNHWSAVLLFGCGIGADRPFLESQRGASVGTHSLDPRRFQAAAVCRDVLLILATAQRAFWSVYFQRGSGLAENPQRSFAMSSDEK